jgi:hypothetical protein
MPQLDTYMYFSQVFWLLIIFIIFYILVLNNILPKISRVLKLRQKQIDVGYSSVMTEEYEVIRLSISLLLESPFKSSTNLINKARNSSFVWLDISLKGANQETLLQLNRNYLNSLGELKGQSFLINNIVKQK